MTQAQANGSGWRGNDEGGKLKEAGTTHWAPDNTGATNSSGFTALGAGFRDQAGGFGDLSYDTHFWTSSTAGDPLRRSLNYSHQDVYRSPNYSYYGHSVRCIKD